MTVKSSDTNEWRLSAKLAKGRIKLAFTEFMIVLIEFMIRTLWEKSDGNHLFQSLFHFKVSNDSMLQSSLETCFAAENLNTSFSHFAPIC